MQNNLRGRLRLLGHRIIFSRRKRSREAPGRLQAAARDRFVPLYFLDAIRAPFVRVAEHFVQAYNLILGRPGAKAARQSFASGAWLILTQ